MRVEVTTLDELPEGVPTEFRAAGRNVVLVRWRERVYALRNICPHMSNSFVGGLVGGRAAGPVGGHAFVDDDPVMTCPWHQFEFVLDDGRCLTDANLRIATYAVSQGTDGTVSVDFPPLSSERSAELPLRSRTADGTVAPAAGGELRGRSLDGSGDNVAYQAARGGRDPIATRTD
jgi:nitrite reductase/ring-hydroxylating ferredoxin subunit